jgi:hypothetical protein
LIASQEIFLASDASSRLNNDSQKIQEEEEALTTLSGSENSNIGNIKSTIPTHTSLIFKQQEKCKEPGSREKSLAQPHYSIQHIEGYDILYYKVYKQDVHPSIIETEAKSTVLVP